MNKLTRLCILGGMAASTAFVATGLQARPAREIAGAKYVFFFIGDGMSATQIQATEAYLTAKNDGDVNLAANLRKTDNILNLNRLPVHGMQTTYAYDHLITDSAAAGTALACGTKTNSGVIGMDYSKTKEFKSIAELAKESGRRVGIISSVSLDHATPASFFANTANRSGYEEVAVEAALSNFDFFGGGGWLYPTSNAYKTLYTKLSTSSVEAVLANEGYSTLNTDAAIRALKTTPRTKVVCTVPVLQSSAAMPYAVDKPAGQVSLAEMTEVAVACLTGNNSGGFFLMVEGGKVDWACHANDPVGTIGDMLDFDDAVGVAIDFYKQHPNDTLIIVTGDHETGGLTLGFSGRGYESAFEKLLGQKLSYEAFGAKVAAYKTAKAFAKPYNTAANNIDQQMKDMILADFGLSFDSLSDYRKNLLEAAYDRSMSGAALAGTTTATGWDRGYGTTETISNVDYLYYGGYDALTMEISHQISYETGLGWTSYSHTAVPIPVMAMGFDDYRFAGFYDNTDIAKSIAAAMRVNATLPIVTNP